MFWNARIFHVHLLAVTLSGIVATPSLASEPVTLTHIHGLTYSADGSRLMIPSHHGLAVFEGGRWTRAPGPAHDFMGFSGTRDTLYSSGHPAPASGMTNPFGLIKSRDGGKTWQQLGLSGESDFHLLATSYGTNAVYVYNHEPNSRMPQAGIYQTRNDGLRWTRATGTGLSGALKSLAVHPTDASTVAIGTQDGLFLSRDAAEQFEHLVRDQPVLSQTFDLDGRHLWFGSYSGKARLSRIALAAGAKAVPLPIPALAKDAVSYIAQNPARPDELAIATFSRHVFVSSDQGRTWKQISTKGVTNE